MDVEMSQFASFSRIESMLNSFGMYMFAWAMKSR